MYFPADENMTGQSVLIRAGIAKSQAIAKQKTPKMIGLAAQGICFERLLYFL